jgi:ppGpp synthetase/RelA/SpoT-type nucleotidyltranferase
MTDAVAEYARRYNAFLPNVAARLADLVRDHLAGSKRVDSVNARAKDPESFALKAERLNDDRQRRYEHPLTQIQDQIGVRIVVFFDSDVNTIKEVINDYFRPIEDQTIVPDSLWKFGYFGKHLILATPKDVVPNDVPIAEVPAFFELQIRTLFQHAWSQANHDIGYKPPGDLTDDQQRRLAYTAAQAWGADREFANLFAELVRGPAVNEA